MKKLLITSILGFLIAAGITNAQNRYDDYLGLPGDNLNLYAVMNLFQESETLEDFERNLNDPDSRINNLDLNGDNLVDYIMVNDYVTGDDHNIVLQVALNGNERQDVAVFTVERFRNGAVQIQLIGDEALYGNNYIVEPIYDDERPNPGYRGSRNNVTYVRTTTFEIAAWPVIRFIYHPRYTIWHSHWHWGYYPTYWNPWRPYYYHYYYGYHRNFFPVYHSHYRHWHQPRYTHYHDHYYTSVRSHSPQVYGRIKSGHYKSTYSRPEQRRDGEALYARTHGNSRSAGNKAVSTRGRRDTEYNNQGRSNSSRSVNASNRRATVNEQNAGRSSRSMNDRVSSNSSGRQNGKYAERKANTVNQRNASNPSAGRGNHGRTENSRPAVNQSSTHRDNAVNRSSNGNSRSNEYSRAKTTSREPQRASTSANRSSRNESVNAGRSSRQTSAAPAARSAQRSESARTPRQSKASSDSGGRSGKSKSEGSAKRSSDDSKSSRR